MVNENDLSGRVGLDTTAFKAGVSELNAQIKSIETSFRASAAVMGNWSSSTAGLQSRVDSLSEKLVLQKQKLSTLNEEYQKTVQSQGANSSAAQSLANQMYSAEKAINSTENDLKKYSAQLKEVKDKSEGITFQKFNDGLAKTSGAATKALKSIGIFVTGVTAAFGKMLSSSVENADELQKLSDVTGFTAEQLQIMRYQGSALGVELDTMTSAQSKLIKAMSAASTGKNGPNAQAKAFQELGIQVRDSSGHLRNSNDIFNEAITRLGNMKNETERDAVAMQIFGKSAMELNPLIKAGGDQLAQMADEAQKSGAVMSNEAVAGLDNFGDSIDAMKLSIQGLIGSAFGKLTPQLNDLTEKIKNLDLSKVTSGISFALDHLPQIGTAIAGVTSAIVAWKIAAETANAVSGISNAIMVISTMRASGLAAAQAALKMATGNTALAQLALNSAWLISPITLIIAGIAALVVAFIALWKNCEGFRNFWIGLWNDIQAVFQQVWGVIQQIATQAWAYIGPTIMQGVQAVQAFWNSVWSEIQQVFSDVWNVIKIILTPIIAYIDMYIRTTLIALQFAWNLAWTNIKNAFKTIWDLMVGIVKVAWTIISGAIKMALDLITGIFQVFKDLFTGNWSALWNDVKNLFSNIWNDIKGIFQGVVDGIGSIFKNLAHDALQWGADIIHNIVNGIKNAASAVGDAVKGVAQDIRKFLHFSVPDEGPLADFESWMPDFMGGLAAGINANKYKVQNAIRGLATDISIGVNPRIASPAYAGATVGGAIINYTSNYYSPAAPTPSEVNRVNRQNAQRIALITRRR